MKKISEKDIRLKYIDILDAEGIKLFKKAMKIFVKIFKEDKYYVKEMRKILRRKSHPANTIFRLLIAVNKNNGQVIGVAIYRHWTDINRTTLEYLMARLDLRGMGIGSMLYKRMKRDLKAIGSKGLYFSCGGDTDLDKYEMEEKWKIINRKRVRFYEKHGAKPLKGIEYNTPLYWNRPKKSYCLPNFLYDPLKSIKRNKRIRVSGKLVKEIVRRVMKTYYGKDSSNYRVREILRSIKTQRLEWREACYVG